MIAEIIPPKKEMSLTWNNNSPREISANGISEPEFEMAFVNRSTAKKWRKVNEPQNISATPENTPHQNLAFL
jgi:hypothetical protein